ncbi:hypothetical protein ROHU_035844 [Labeo rohita]|uniref:Uncharacterized protein n=1 Tax=Labeo rohita TaxID=84645 RepID=A0A498L2T8_LABRO|nr:hypothetical protein ROHU_035844 [Labeo rohita]
MSGRRGGGVEEGGGTPAGLVPPGSGLICHLSDPAKNTPLDFPIRVPPLPVPGQVFLSIRSLGTAHEEAHLRRRRWQNGEVEEETEGRGREGEGLWEGAGYHSGRSLIPPEREAPRRGTNQHGLNLDQVLRFGQPHLTMRT